jgi:hypothetical protein
VTEETNGLCYSGNVTVADLEKEILRKNTQEIRSSVLELAQKRLQGLTAGKSRKK